MDRMLVVALFTSFSLRCAPAAPRVGPPREASLADAETALVSSSAIEPPRAALDHPPRAGSLGAQCNAVTPCAAGLHCDDDDARGFCTRDCVPSGDRRREAGACLAETGTCVAFGSDRAAPGLCAPACDPIDPDACATGRACTVFAWVTSSLDAPGCFPFCRRDEDCVTGAHCNSRTGECGARGVDVSLASDGTACDPRDREPFCRGFCLRLVPAEIDRGLCASLVDRAAVPRCPDDPERIAPTVWSNDGLAVCVYRTCDGAFDCPPDTHCSLGDRAGLCVPP